jgi:hypothetical protein
MSNFDKEAIRERLEAAKYTISKTVNAVCADNEYAQEALEVLDTDIAALLARNDELEGEVKRLRELLADAEDNFTRDVDMSLPEARRVAKNYVTESRQHVFLSDLKHCKQLAAAYLDKCDPETCKYTACGCWRTED